MMKSLKNILIRSTVAATARLPFGVLYVLADITYFFLYRVAGYRKRIVRANLRNAFPELDRHERRAIEKEFYQGFADYIFETIKYSAISAKKLRQRMTFENIALLDRLFAEGKTVIAYFSHCGNWEWVTFIGQHYVGRTDVQLGEVYRPLKDKFIDKLMLDIRTRFNTACYPKRLVFRDLLKLKKDGVLTCTGFMSDQKTSHGDELYEIEFLNQKTAVITGTEVVARKMKAAVIYFDMTKLSRGHYHLRLRHIADDASTLPPYELTNRYFAMLEDNIRRQPAIWLWSHNRWRLKKSELKNMSLD